MPRIEPTTIFTLISCGFIPFLGIFAVLVLQQMIFSGRISDPPPSGFQRFRNRSAVCLRSKLGPVWQQSASQFLESFKHEKGIPTRRVKYSCVMLG